jgi:hypothetical protein
MDRLIAVAFVFAGFLRVAGAQTTLTVRIYNPAHVSPNTLVKVRDEAAYILRSAGIRTAWVTCTYPGECPKPASVLDVVVRLAPDTVFPKKDTPDRRILGRAVTGHGKVADYVEVYNAPIQKLVAETEIASGADVIGAVIAHEVGHLFLGSRHSRSGLMSACWSPRELALLARRKLKFDQFEKIELKRQFVLHRPPRQREAGIFARNQIGW